jgi:serine/threonine protein phosphatase 1
MMLDCKWAFGMITDDSIEGVSAHSLECLELWRSNGGEPTITAMRELLHKDHATVEAIFDYLEDTPICETLEIEGKAFVLCHAGFGNFEKDKRLTDYSAMDLLWHRPHPDEEYFEDAMTVIGHTPTGYYGSSGKAFKTKTWIDIDVGVSRDRAPMILRLDDMKEIYF